MKKIKVDRIIKEQFVIFPYTYLIGKYVYIPSDFIFDVVRILDRINLHPSEHYHSTPFLKNKKNKKNEKNKTS